MAHRNVVLLGAGEVVEREVELLGRHDAQVRLQTVLEAHAGLRLAVGGDLLDARVGDEPVHDRLGFRRRHEEVEVADRLAGAAKRTGGLGERDLRQRAEAGEDRFGDGGRFVPAVPLAVGDTVLDALEDLLLGLGAEALELGDRAGLADLLQFREIRDGELRPERADLLGPEPGNLHDLEQAGGDRSLELLVEWQDTVAAERRDLVDQRLAQPGNVGQLASVDELAEVLGQVLKDAGAPRVRADLERVLTRQLHQGGDLVEDRRDVGFLHHGRRAFSAW